MNVINEISAARSNERSKRSISVDGKLLGQLWNNVENSLVANNTTQEGKFDLETKDQYQNNIAFEAEQNKIGIETQSQKKIGLDIEQNTIDLETEQNQIDQETEVALQRFRRAG